VITATAFVTFIGIVWWAYAPSRKSRFDDDARLPFDGDEQ
jgi:cytochrome c oxidase cbb3-type subunit 4